MYFWTPGGLEPVANGDHINNKQYTIKVGKETSAVTSLIGVQRA